MHITCTLHAHQLDTVHFNIYKFTDFYDLVSMTSMTYCIVDLLLQ